MAALGLGLSTKHGCLSACLPVSLSLSPLAVLVYPGFEFGSGFTTLALAGYSLSVLLGVRALAGFEAVFCPA